MALRDIDMRFICTDQGQHESRELALFVYGFEGGQIWERSQNLLRGESEVRAAEIWERVRLELQNFTLKRFKEGRTHGRNRRRGDGSPSCDVVYYGEWDEHQTYVMKCPTCIPPKQMGREKVIKLMLSYNEAGLGAVDISRVP